MAKSCGQPNFKKIEKIKTFKIIWAKYRKIMWSAKIIKCIKKDQRNKIIFNFYGQSLRFEFELKNASHLENGIVH